jgi:hypothetical protein
VLPDGLARAIETSQRFFLDFDNAARRWVGSWVPTPLRPEISGAGATAFRDAP